MFLFLLQLKRLLDRQSWEAIVVEVYVGHLILRVQRDAGDFLLCEDQFRDLRTIEPPDRGRHSNGLASIVGVLDFKDKRHHDAANILELDDVEISFRLQQFFFFRL